MLIKSGKDLITNGDFAAARLSLRRAADGGSGEAASRWAQHLTRPLSTSLGRSVSNRTLIGRENGTKRPPRSVQLPRRSNSRTYREPIESLRLDAPHRDSRSSCGRAFIWPPMSFPRRHCPNAIAPLLFDWPDSHLLAKHLLDEPQMINEPLRVACIGMGWWSDVLADAITRSGKLEIVSCYTRSERKRQTFATKYRCRAAASYDDILADAEVEAIINTTPNDVHLETTRAAALAGKHIFLDKPIANSVSDGRTISRDLH